MFASSRSVASGPIASRTALAISTSGPPKPTLPSKLVDPRLARIPAQ
jgi:hypothetical protein